MPTHRALVCALSFLMFCGIAYAGTINVTLPSDANLFYARAITGQEIHWTASGVTGNVKIELYKNGVFDSVIKDSLPATDGTFAWTIPAAQAANPNYKVRVTSLANAADFDESDNDFAIVDPYISLIKPGTQPGNVVYRGLSNAITWSANTGGTATIQLLKGGVLQTPNPIAVRSSQYYGFQSTYQWTPSATLALGTDYRIRLTSSLNGLTSESNFDFEVKDLQINILQPAAGTIWPAGSFQQLIFSTDISDTYKIELYKNGVFKSTIHTGKFFFASPPNSVHGFQIGANETPGNDYKIRLTPITFPNLFKESDVFTISGVLTVTKPAVGAQWGAGGPHPITWDSLAGGNAKIELYKGGVFDSELIASAPNNGSYTWTVPANQQLGSDYTVKVTSLSDNVSGTSSDFEIQTPSMLLTYPGGGEKLGRGRSHEIQWTANLEGNVKLELYKSGVLNLPIINSTQNDGKHPWTIPANQVPGNDYRVRVSSLETPTVTSESFSNVTIGDPSILVTAPNTAFVALVDTNESINITWTTNLVQEKVKIELVKGGAVNTTVDGNHGNDGFANFPIPANQTLGNDYKVRISTLDGVVSDESDVNFSIEVPRITVTSPNGGEQWPAGSNQTITWTSNLPSEPIGIELLKNGAVHRTLNTFSNTGTAQLTLPTDLVPDSDYKIRLTALSRTGISDDSDAAFTILPRLKVVAPNGGELWPQGTQQNIKWTSDLVGTVSIQLYKGGVLNTTINGNAPDTGSFTWDIPPGQALGTDYKIKITDTSDGTVLDDSDQNFSIVARTITITSPIGGENFARGKNRSITWTCNFAGNVKLELLSGGPTTTIAANTSGSVGNNSFSWDIPPNQSIASDYKVRITSLVDGSINSQSPAPFSINAPTITVSSPNGGDQVVRGTQQTIVWTTNFSDPVKIELLKGAAAPVEIIGSTENDGIYGWQVLVNQAAGNDYKVRISTLDNTVNDTSDAAFSVIAHNITLTAPNGGEVRSVGTSLQIEWTSNFQGASNVKIELLKNGAPHTTIGDSLQNTHSYFWPIPANQSTGNDYRVRISSVLDVLAVDTSDADFTIRPNQPPVANAGQDQTVKETRIGFAKVSLSGSASTDDGSLSPLTYTWKEGATTLGTGQFIQPELSLGDHTVTLTVNDGQLERSDDVVIHVLANVAPVADAGPDITVLQALINGTNVQVNGTATDDGSLNPQLNFTWKEGATVLATSSGFSQVFSVGTHTLTLTVDDGQYTHSDTTVVKVLPAPNLVVEASIIVPPDTYTGRDFDVTWTVKNIGGGPATGPWADHIYLSEDDQPGGDIDLGAFEFAGSLAPGESVMRTQVVKVPNSPTFQDKAYRLLIATDGISQDPPRVNEGPFEGDNVTASAPFNVHPLPLPDLIVESIDAPPIAFSGQPLTVKYVVKNTGQGGTDLPVWYDKIYLSVDNVPDSSDLIQTLIPNVSALAPQEKYTGSVTFTIGTTAAGPFNIIIKANDGSKKLLESVSNNNTNLKALQINVPSVPDLQITQFTAPSNGFSDQTVTLNWTIENKGPVPAVPTNGTISDQVFISQQASLNNVSEIALGIFTHSGAIDNAKGYAQSNISVRLPARISGAWNLFLVTDYNNSVFEHAGEANNVAKVPIMVVRSPEPDLVVASVTPPPTAKSGQKMTVQWSLKNQGAADALTPWSDGVYLSLDTTLSGDDIFLGSHGQQSLKADNVPVTSSETFVLPTELSGDYYVLVYVDHPAPGGQTQLPEFDPNLDAEANNITASTNKVTITWTPSDLQVTSVTAPTAGLAAKNITVAWTVKNFGPGGTELVTNWSDSVYLSTTPVLNTLTAVKLGDFAHNGALSTDGTYSNSKAVMLPVDQPAGNYYVFVVADSSRSVAETGHEDNNDRSAPVQIQVANTPPDFVVDSVSPPPTVGSGKVLNFSWVTRNAGPGPTLGGDFVWRDQVYLSKNQTLETSGPDADIALFRDGYFKGGVLAIGESYTGTGSYKLPYTISGTYYLIAVTDVGAETFEGAAEGNNVKVSAPFTITLTPAPDLTIISPSAAPASAQSGQFVDVAYTVKNVGTNPTDADSPDWFDRIYISRDLVLDPSDKAIGSFMHSGALAVNASYQNTIHVELPRDISGPYNLFIVTDANGKVFEGDDVNNIVHIPLPVTLAPPSDLTVTGVNVGAPTAMYGSDYSFSYTLSNPGLNKADGSWTDNVYLSLDTKWDAGDALVGSLVHTGDTIQPNASLPVNFTGKIPPILPGNYYVIVRADIRNNIRESDETNNMGISTQTLALDVPELTLGVARDGTLKQDKTDYYKVLVPDGADLLISLDSTSATDFNDLLAARKFLPSAGSFEFAHDDPNRSDQQILISSAVSGYYYIYVHGNKVKDEGTQVGGIAARASYQVPSTPFPTRPPNIPNHPYTITAKVLDFSIVDVTPNRGGNGGRITPLIRGAKFSALTTAKLVKGNVERNAQKIYFINTTKIHATFDLVGLAAGTYDVVLNDGAKSATAPGGFTVVEAPATGQDPVLAAIFCPPALRIGTTAVLTIGYGNTTENDLDAPLFQPNADYSQMRLSADVPFDKNGEEVVGINFSGPAGFLPPGARNSISYQYTDVKRVGLSMHRAPQFTTADASLVDFGELEKTFRPATSADATWVPLWQHFRDACGPTFGGFLTVMDKAATTASLRGLYIFRLDDLFQYAGLQSYHETLDNLTGNVYLNDLSHPLKGEVAVSLDDAAGERSSASATEGDGSVRFTQVALGTYKITVDRYVVKSPTELVVGNATPPVTIIVSLGASISGIIKDADNQPFPGVGVLAVDANGATSQAESDSEGNYVFSGLKQGTYSVSAGFVQGVVTHSLEGIVLTTDTEAKTGVDLQLYETLPLSGTVTSMTSNQPIGGAHVVALLNGVAVDSTIAEANGSYTLVNLEPGDYTLTFRADNFLTTTAPTTLVSKKLPLPFDTKLVPQGKITVTVTDAATGNPIADAQSLISQGSEILEYALTEANGTAVYEELSANTYNVYAAPQGYAPANANVTLATGDNKFITLAATKVGSISGTVKTGNGTPMPHVRLTAVADDGNRTTKYTTSDAAGSYRIDLGNGTYAVYLGTEGSSGISRYDFTISAAGDQTHDFVISGASISGTVFESDGVTPALGANARLVLNGRRIVEAPCLTSGKYCFFGVAPGNYTVEAYALKRVFNSISAAVTANQAVTDKSLVAGGHSISGFISGTNSAPIAGANVYLDFLPGARSGSSAHYAVADANGAYTLNNIPPGNYSLRASASGKAVNATPVTVPATGDLTQNLTLNADKPLTVNVAGSAAMPVADAIIRVFNASTGDLMFLNFTENDGHATLRSLTAANYHIVVSADNYRSNFIANFDNGANNTLNVTLAGSPLSISGTIRSSDSKPLSGATVVAINAQNVAIASTTSTFNGSYQLTDLPAGNYSIVARAPGYEANAGPSFSVSSNITGKDATLNAIAFPDPPPLFDISRMRIHTKKTIANSPSRTGVARRPDDPLTLAPINSKCPKADALYNRLHRYFDLKEMAFEELQSRQDDAVRTEAFNLGNYILNYAVLAANLSQCGLDFLTFGQSAGESQTSGALLDFGIDALGITGQNFQSQIPDNPVAFTKYEEFLGTTNKVVGNIGAAADAANIGINITENILGNRVPGPLVKGVPAAAVVADFVSAATQYEQTRLIAERLQDDIYDLQVAISNRKGRYNDAVAQYNSISRLYADLSKKCNGELDKYQKKENFRFRKPNSNSGPNNGGGGGGGGGSGTGWFLAGDPNEKRGPEGFGPGRHVAVGSALTFTVLCENDGEATAPVQKLDIEDQLDPALDLRTYRIKEIVLGATTIPVPGDAATYSGRTSVVQSTGETVDIDVFAGVDIFTGRMFLLAEANDPATGQAPQNPALGFMPPNDASHRGEGHIVYSIAPLLGVLSGTKVVNKASIKFDTNEIIETNEVFNTIDGEAPVSGVTALPPQSEGSTLNISWSGTDAGNAAGVKSFDIYYSDNGGAYVRWQSGVTTTSAALDVQTGHTYRFFSIASDYGGNKEATPSVPDTQTIMVTHVNRAPTTMGLADVSVTEDVGETAIALDAAFDDLEDGDTGLVYTVSGNTNSGIFDSAAIDTFHLLTLNYSGVLGSSTLTVRATDSEGLFVETSFKVTVNALPKSPPTITSKLTDSTRVGANYTYTTTATGDNPIVFSAGNLPPGLAFAGAAITGSPTTAGTFDIALTATNATGSDSKTLKLTVTDTPPGTVNLPPAFASTPLFTPRQPVVGTPVTFTAAATDPNSDSLTYTWNFGDGTTGTGASVTHIYTVSDLYKVSVIVSDGLLSASAEVTVEVVVFELADFLDISKVSVHFSFSSSGKDSLTIAGTTPLPKGIVIAGTTARLFVGDDLYREFVLDPKGKGGDKLNAFKLQAKSKKGVLEPTAKFTITLKSQALLSELKSLGFENATVSKQVKLPCYLGFDQTGYYAEPTMNYNAKAGKSGSAKN